MFKKSNSTREMTKNKQKENTKRQINQKAKGNKQKLKHDKKKRQKRLKICANIAYELGQVPMIMLHAFWREI